MIHNPTRIYNGVPPHGMHEYKLRLLTRHLLEPVADRFNLTITSGYRTLEQQSNLTDASGNLVPANVKAKKISQHCLGEAVDFVADFPLACYKWMNENLHPWVMILYYRKTFPSHIHMSMLPEKTDNRGERRLLNIDGTYKVFTGSFPT